ncbi:hypothetical protein C8J57DRAFT_1627951 [Mycena rebaudengoi]|nr:hypothetical protein C8J57DRAFT_1627951 [Mycena rebaudengoi]
MPVPAIPPPEPARSHPEVTNLDPALIPSRLTTTIFICINDPAEQVPPKVQNTVALIRAIVMNFQRVERLLFIYKSVLDRVIYDEIDAQPQKAHLLRPLLQSNFLDFLLDHGFTIGFSAYLEQPYMGNVIWGQTNWKADLDGVVGHLVPVINLRVCEAYEDTFREESLTSVLRRGQLGTLITFTFFHELAHAWLHTLLRGILPPKWSTPNIEPGTHGDSGAEVEERLFWGKLGVFWGGRDAYEEDRFNRIESMWMQPTIGLFPMGPLHLIPEGHLVAFHNRVLASDINTELIHACLGSEASQQRQMAAQLKARDGRLLRWSAGPAGITLPDPLVYEMEFPPWCLIGFERAVKQNPRLLEKWGIKPQACRAEEGLTNMVGNSVSNWKPAKRSI